MKSSKKMIPSHYKQKSFFNGKKVVEIYSSRNYLVIALQIGQNIRSDKRHIFHKKITITNVK
jgi:hypothetical protein